jgi:hypothetical protein
MHGHVIDLEARPQPGTRQQLAQPLCRHTRELRRPHSKRIHVEIIGNIR